MGRDFSTEKKAAIRRPKFHQKGQSFTGRLLAEPFDQPALQYGTSEPKTYSDGRPVIDKVYDFLLVSEGPDCQPNCHYCGLSNERTDEDDGTRRIYANWIQHRKIQEAFAETHKRDGKLQLGGQLTLKYEGDDMTMKKPGKQAPKIWSASYKNPTAEDDKVVDAHLAANEPTDDSSMSKMTYEELINMSGG